MCQKSKSKLTRKPIPIDPAKILFRYIFDARHARETHAQSNFIHEEAQTQLDAFLALVRQSPEHGPSNPAEVRAESEGLEDVGAVADTAVDMNGDFAVDGGHDFRKGVKRGQGAVELAAAVVRDDDAVDAVVDGQYGVFGCRDPLDPDLHFACLGFEPWDRFFPGQSRVGGVRVECYWARRRVPFVAVVVACYALFGLRFWCTLRGRVGMLPGLTLLMRWVAV